jgi:hypothetical protein
MRTPISTAKDLTIWIANCWVKEAGMRMTLRIATIDLRAQQSLVTRIVSWVVMQMTTRKLYHPTMKLTMRRISMTEMVETMWTKTLRLSMAEMGTLPARPLLLLVILPLS